MEYITFKTPLGICALAWNQRGLIRVQLPEENVEATVRRLLGGGAGAAVARPPAWVRDAARRIALHLQGQEPDLSSLPLDLQGVPPFHRRVYELARTVPRGQTVTYGELASRLGSLGAARAVGQAMAKNPLPIVVPCHRLLGAGGRLGGFSAFGGVSTKARLLEMEGVALGRERQICLFQGDGKLPFDPDEALRHLAAADAKLARLMERVGPFQLQIESLQSPFEALAEAIVYQHLAGKAAATIFARFKALFGRRRFPRPAQILEASDESLRGAGLSRAKVAALRDLAVKTAEGLVPPLGRLGRMGEEEIIERLTRIRGVGRWTVEMLLIFRLGRPDVLPATDYGIRKGFALAFGMHDLPPPSLVLERGLRWRPYRTVASWYLWRAAEG
jgi:methylated-DNA-[protein]-cysteine S-methyltransferase